MLLKSTIHYIDNNKYVNYENFSSYKKSRRL